MRVLYMFFLVLMSCSLLASSDCDKPKPDEKKGGCKVEQTSEGFITCLIQAKTPEQTQACHKKEKERKCKAIHSTFKTIKEEECALLYSPEQVDCLIKAKTKAECLKKEAKTPKKENKTPSTTKQPKK